MRDKDLEKYIEKLFIDVDLGRSQILEKATLSPDSFITLIQGGYESKKVYACYEEDAVLRLSDIENAIEKFSGKKVIRFFKAINPQLEPNEHYPIRPLEWDGLAKYAALGGIYYQFFAELE